MTALILHRLIHRSYDLNSKTWKVRCAQCGELSLQYQSRAAARRAAEQHARNVSHHRARVVEVDTLAA